MVILVFVLLFYNHVTPIAVLVFDIHFYSQHTDYSWFLHVK